MSAEQFDFEAIAEPTELREAELLFSLSRRHAFPFSVLAIAIAPPGAEDEHPDEKFGTSALLLAASHLESVLGDTLRTTDLLVRCSEPGFYTIFCSYTSAEGAKELAERLSHSLEECEIQVGIASFRDHAVTLAGLLESVWSEVDAPTSEFRRSLGFGSSGRGEVLTRGRRPTLGLSRRRRASLRLKRYVDVAITLAIAPLWLPAVAVIALAIKFSDPSGNVFFIQPRTGKGGRRFGMYKFRTMVPDAETRKADLGHLNMLAWPDFKVDKDPRITRLGHVLRKTSLDELPQVLNVLAGDMSLVGPRPTSFAPDTYEPWQTARLDVVPGITGLWQVEGRGSTEFDVRLRLDLEYVENQSFFYDFWLLLRTVGAVFQMRGSR